MIPLLVLYLYTSQSALCLHSAEVPPCSSSLRERMPRFCSATPTAVYSSSSGIIIGADRILMTWFKPCNLRKYDDMRRQKLPLTQTFLPPRTVRHMSLEQHINTDAGTSTPFGGLWTFWVRQKRAPRELASTLPAAIGTTAEARGAVRGAFHLLPCSRASVSKSSQLQHGCCVVDDDLRRINLVDTY